MSNMNANLTVLVTDIDICMFVPIINLSIIQCKFVKVNILQMIILIDCWLPNVQCQIFQSCLKREQINDTFNW